MAPYFIKSVWKDGATTTPEMRFSSIQEALDFAAAALSQSPKGSGDFLAGPAFWYRPGNLRAMPHLRCGREKKA
jgi:hypothetical protein